MKVTIGEPLWNRQKGVYYVRLQRNGVRKYITLGPKYKDEQVKKLERDLARGVISFDNVIEVPAAQPAPAGRDMRLEELIVRHLEWMEANRTPGTYRNRKTYTHRFLDFVGPCMVSGITRLKLEEFYAWSRRNYGRGANGGNQAISAIKSLLRWGEEMELVDLPIRRFPKIKHVPPKTKRLEDDALTRLLTEAPSDLRDLLVFGLLTGLRPQEIRQLRRENILTSKDGRMAVFIEIHKTSSTARNPRPRSVPLSNLAEEIVRRQLASHPRSNHVFVNTAGDAYTNYTLRNRLRRLCTRLGMPLVSTYALRHTFASLESEAGIESTSLARLMGHSTTRTLERYVSNTSAFQREAVQRVEISLRPIIDLPVKNTQSHDAATAERSPRRPKKLTEVATAEPSSEATQVMLPPQPVVGGCGNSVATRQYGRRARRRKGFVSACGVTS